MARENGAAARNPGLALSKAMIRALGRWSGRFALMAGEDALHPDPLAAIQLVPVKHIMQKLKICLGERPQVEGEESASPVMQIFDFGGWRRRHERDW
jgi:hypothetical protein